MEGLALVSSSHGFKSESNKMSSPYNAKQCLSLMITFCTL